jgi:hypothetical protein
MKFRNLRTISDASSMRLPTIGTTLPVKFHNFPAMFFAIFQALLNQSDNLLVEVEISSFKCQLE